MDSSKVLNSGRLFAISEFKSAVKKPANSSTSLILTEMAVSLMMS